MKNFLTFSKLDSKCREQAGIAENDIAPEIRQTIINDIIYKAYGLLDGINHPFWNRTITLTVAADQEHLKDSATNSGTITAIDSTAKTITRSSGTFEAGAILDIVVVTKSSGLIAGQWKARVTVAGATATYEKIGSGTEVTYASATHVCSVNVMKTLSETSADISTQYVKEVIEVHDDQGADNKPRVFFKEEDIREFNSLHKKAFRTKEIAYHHSGNTVHFNVGATATALGVVQAEVVTKPALYTDATEDNEVDFPPEENMLVTDEIVAEYLMKTGRTLPPDLASRRELYRGRYQAAAEDKMKAMERKNTSQK